MHVHTTFSATGPLDPQYRKGSSTDTGRVTATAVYNTPLYMHTSYTQLGDAGKERPCCHRPLPRYSDVTPPRPAALSRTLSWHLLPPMPRSLDAVRASSCLTSSIHPPDTPPSHASPDTPLPQAAWCHKGG